MRLNTSILAFTLTSQLLAGTILPRSVCPALTQEAQAIISNIEVLKQEVDVGRPECSTLSSKLGDVSKIISSNKWVEIRNLFQGSSTPALEGDDVEQISALATDVSRTLTEVVEGLQGNNEDCIKNKERFLSKLSNVVREASSVIGNVTGPYGAAINLGGNIIAGVIKGIDLIIEKTHYNFNDPALKNLYINQFCAFSEIQKDINDYIDLDSRTAEIDILDAYLKIKVNDLRKNCPECEGYEIAWKTFGKANKIVNRMKAVADVVKLDEQRFDKKYTRCHEIHRAFHTEDSDFLKLMNLLDGYTNPMASQSDNELISATVSTSKKLPMKFKSLEECILGDYDNAVRLSEEFNMIMRDEFFPIKDKIFYGQLKSMQFRANMIYKNPLGDYISKSLERQKWLKKQRADVQRKLNDPNYSFSTQAIIESKEDLENKIIHKRMPQFLKFQKRTTLKSIKKVKKSIRQLNLSKSDNRVRLSQEKRLTTSFRLILDQTNTHLRYCDYLKYMLNGTTKSEQICNDHKLIFKTQIKELSSISSIFSKMAAKRNLFKPQDTQLYQTSRLQEFSLKVKTWTARGDERWCKKNSQTNICRERN